MDRIYSAPAGVRSVLAKPAISQYTYFSAVYGERMMSQVFGTKPWTPGEYRRFVRDTTATLAYLVVAGVVMNLLPLASSGRALANLVVGSLIATQVTYGCFGWRNRSRQRQQAARGSAVPVSKSWLDAPSSRPGMVQIGQNRFLKKKYLTAFLLAWVSVPLALAVLWAHLMTYGVIGYMASLFFALLLVWFSIFIAILVILRLRRSHNANQGGTG